MTSSMNFLTKKEFAVAKKFFTLRRRRRDAEIRLPRGVNIFAQTVDLPEETCEERRDPLNQKMGGPLATPPLSSHPKQVNNKITYCNYKRDGKAKLMGQSINIFEPPENGVICIDDEEEIELPTAHGSIVSKRSLKIPPQVIFTNLFSSRETITYSEQKRSGRRKSQCVTIYPPVFHELLEVHQLVCNSDSF